MSNGDLPEAQPTADTDAIQQSENREPETRSPEPYTDSSDSGFTVAPPDVEESRPGSPALALAVAAGAWLVPGLGHLLLGRWVRSLLLAASVFSLFALGLRMEGKLYGWEFDRSPAAQSVPLQALEFFGDAGVGLPYVAAMKMGMGTGNLENRSFDYGEKFLWVAGLLNYLILLDAFDIAMGRKP
jgi:hypothetical protein